MDDFARVAKPRGTPAVVVEVIPFAPRPIFEGLMDRDTSGRGRGMLWLEVLSVETFDGPVAVLAPPVFRAFNGGRDDVEPRDVCALTPLRDVTVVGREDADARVDKARARLWAGVAGVVTDVG